MNIFGKMKHAVVTSVTRLGGAGRTPNTQKEQAAAYANMLGLFFGNSYGSQYTGATISGSMAYPDVTTLDYYTLRERSWSAMAKDELAAMVVRRLISFVIGDGLKLQAEPMFRLLKSLGVNTGTDQSKKDLVDFIEDLFKVNSKNKKLSDTTSERTLHKLAKTALYNALVGGDVLIINRVIDGVSKIQIVDGANVCDPGLFCFDKTIMPEEIEVKLPDGKTEKRKVPAGHRVINGVEVDSSGTHVGYYVSQITDKPVYDNDSGKSDEEKKEDVVNTIPVFVPAWGEKTGRRTAWLLYGNEYRLGETRGMPMLGVVMEKAELLRRYSRSEVLNSEQSAKIIGFIEHGQSSTGLNPMKPKVVNRNTTGVERVDYDGSSKLNGDQIAENFAKNTGGNVINLGKDQKVNKWDTSRPPASYKDYYDANAKYICAALDVPWEVALMVFTNNFSASRMAAKLFEGGALLNWRQSLNDNFYKPYYDTFFMLTALQYDIKVPGYIKALLAQDEIILSAYTNARFIGKALPHVDPLKEANTVKVLKEISGRSMSSMVEETYGEDYADTLAKIQKEQEMVEKLGISSPQETKTNNGNNGDVDEINEDDEDKNT